MTWEWPVSPAHAARCSVHVPAWATRPEGALGHGLGAVYGFEGQHGVLEIRRQEQEVEELADPRPREPQLPRHVGPVGDRAPVDGGL